MKILVTGGAGFIGSQFVRDLLDGEESPKITVLDKLTYAGNRANLPATGFDFVHGDIADPHLLATLMPGTDVVVNFAAETHVDRSIADPTAFLRTNVLGVQTLLDAARTADVTTFLQVSTDEVYGSIETGSWPETDPLLPNSPYAAAKAGADLLCRSYHRTYGMDVRITRCSNNYGPYQFPEKVIPLFVTNLLRGIPVPLYGDGGNVRDWLHVRDHCRGIRLVLAKGTPGEIYNIGGGVELTNRELTERLLAACGADWSLVRQVPDRLGHDRRYSVDHSKIAGLGYAPEVDLDTGLAETVEWYRTNPSRWPATPAPVPPQPTTSAVPDQPSPGTAPDQPSTTTVPNQPDTGTVRDQPGTVPDRPEAGTVPDHPGAGTVPDRPGAGTVPDQPGTSTVSPPVSPTGASGR